MSSTQSIDEQSNSSSSPSSAQQPPSEHELQFNALTSQMLPISLGQILASLASFKTTISFNDALKYTVVTLSVLIVILYLFPSHIVLILLLAVLIVILIIGLVIKRESCQNFAIRTASEKLIVNKPINSEKLRKLRESIRKNK
nr:TPA: hypothetical protein [Oryctes rhinoceros nudivirus]